jgi:hypothetical protein
LNQDQSFVGASAGQGCVGHITHEPISEFV